MGHFMSLEEGPHLPLGPGFRVGLGGEHRSRAGSWRLKRWWRVASAARGPLLSSGSGPCTRLKARATGSFRDWVPGCQRQWRWRLRVPGAPGQKPLLQGTQCVLRTLHILRAAALIFPLSRAWAPSASCEVFFLTEPPPLPCPSPHAQDDLSCAATPSLPRQRQSVSSARLSRHHRQHVGAAHGGPNEATKGKGP